MNLLFANVAMWAANARFKTRVYAERGPQV
jgi:hypothetical protein